MVAPEPGVGAPECSGVCLPIADRMLFPFMPDRQDRTDEEEEDMT